MRYRIAMTKPLYAAILGGSLVMAGIVRILSERSDLRIQHFAQPEDLLHLQGEFPVLLICDSTVVTSDQILPLIRSHPGLVLMGIDVQRNLVLTHTCETHMVATADDLWRLIGTITTYPAPAQLRT